MADTPTTHLNPRQRVVLEILDAGAWITAGTEGPNGAVAIEGGPKNPPRITPSDVEDLLELEMIYEVWDEEETMTRNRYIISRTGHEYLADHPSPLTASPQTEGGAG